MNTRALKEGEKVAKYAILNLIALGSLKLAAGLVTGMYVIIADAISTFADVLGVFASYFGLKLSRKSANQKFEYGYYKVETFAALLISVGIIFAGYEILREGIITLQTPTAGEHRVFAITTTVIAIAMSIRLARKLSIAGKKVNSLSLLANARDKNADIFAGFIVLISIIANYKQIPYVEGIVTILISLVILKEGLFSSKESLFFLLDYWDDPILTRKIQKIFRKEKDLIVKVKRLRLRRAGTFIFGEAFIEINPYAELMDLREELNMLQEKIKETNPYIKDFAIYTHVSKEDNVKVAVPVKEGRGLSSKVASNLKQTGAYLFANIRKGKIKEVRTRKLPANKKQPVEFANFLKKEKVNIVINNKLNSLIYYNLRRTHHIEVYPCLSNIKTAKQALKSLIIDV